MNPENVSYLDLGSWIGRGQALGAVANQTMAAQAKCWLYIRDSEAYKTLDLTWEAFCQQQIGLSRMRVDTLIQNLQEFGETYFRLSEIIHISPEAYRQISPSIDEQDIEIDGDLVPIVPQNAVRIRKAVHQMRDQLRRAREKKEPAPKTRIRSLRKRLEVCLDDAAGLTARSLDPPDQASLRGAVEDSALGLLEVAERLRAA